jgi:hypothetical protein
MQLAAQGFGEDISKVGVGTNVLHGEMSTLNQLAKEEVPKSNVLGFGVVYRVL